MSRQTSERPGAGSSLRVRAGDCVEVRSKEEILASLDEDGAIDRLPFMPEMLEHCGKRFRVDKRADKTCDTIDYRGSRRMYDTVHLQGARCNGAAHGGCQAGCLMFWREAWLKRVDQGEMDLGGASTGTDAGHLSVRSTTEWQTLERLARQPGESDDGVTRYRCQATELLRASSPMPWWDVRQYWRDVRSGNVRLGAVVRAGLFRLYCKLLEVGGYRALIRSYNRLQGWRGGTPYPYVSGTLDVTPRATLDLQPGELVRVKSQEEILNTVNKRNRNQGLSFDPEMVRYCSGVHRVLARVERIIDERTGKMLEMKRDCIILEGVYCRAEYSNNRLFCPRSLYPFWREIWLQRVEGGAPGETTRPRVQGPN